MRSRSIVREVTGYACNQFYRVDEVFTALDDRET
jgi:hypothetical protein